MHVVLTHEQADFDALASLLGVYLLDDQTVPVLPRRMNRNVRAYLTLYGVELPFVDPRDLTGKPIDEITLVDTQTMVTLRGMHAHTRVHVVDHHPAHPGVPAEWMVTRAELGATTTLLVEEIQANHVQLTMIEATLLLLGIYEDTGSLTYTRTTARDLLASAFLLEQGASLAILNNFINHPLSLAQQELYEQLRANVETSTINGHAVMITTADAQDMDEEFSSVVHKLRDLLDPDAIFVLVASRGGVQMIARSTDDHIDVAEVLAHFGGGGHERAAAVLTRGLSITELRAELLKILPDFVHPAITVAQIMSRGPQVTSADELVSAVAQRMQRFGYEGYPVVKGGQLVGLLTRRGVDRSIAHHLTQTAEKVMEKGNYTVQPADSIEHLQRIMAESGWGQIPVVSPDGGEIIGIVTRTDLLKTLIPKPSLPSQQNLAERLVSALPAARLNLLHKIAQAAHDQRIALYIVGGFVRDLILDHPSQDFDLVVEGDAIRLAQALAERYGGRVTCHTQFGTAKWHLRSPGPVDAAANQDDQGFGQPPTTDLLLDVPSLPDTIDLVSARTEFYTHPSALPTVETGSIKLDLHRRDFSINTLALRLDGHHYGELHDYWGGLDDLKQGIVRVLHSLSFMDDPTRMLRAVRFEKRFNFQIQERTLELMEDAKPMLERVSGDRIRHELDHCLEEPNLVACLRRLHELSLLQVIHPALHWDAWLEGHLAHLSGVEIDPEWRIQENQPGQVKRELAYTLWLVRLPADEIQMVCRRLKFSVAHTKAILAAAGVWRCLPELARLKPSQVVERLEDIPAISLYAVYLIAEEARQKEILLAYISRWQNLYPTINGEYLAGLGLKPGPDYKRLLTRLRQAYLDGEITTFEQEQGLLQEMLHRDA